MGTKAIHSEKPEEGLWVYHIERIVDFFGKKDAKRNEPLIKTIFGQSIKDAIDLESDKLSNGDIHLLCGLRAAGYFFLNGGFDESGLDSLLLEQVLYNAVADCVDSELMVGEGRVWPAILNLLDCSELEIEEMPPEMIVNSLFWDNDWEMFEIAASDRLIHNQKLLAFKDIDAIEDGTVGFKDFSVFAPARKPQQKYSKGGFVYVVKGSSDPVKIGYTSGDPAHRLRCLQTSHHEKLSVVAAFRHPMAGQIEKSAHSLLSQFRLEGEWFSCPPSLAIDTIKSLINKA